MRKVCRMPKTNTMLTSAEACELLAIDRSTLSRWVASGRIRSAFKMPGRTGGFLFAKAEVERVLAELRSSAAS